MNKDKKIPIIIDTDPGVDDFFCIAIGCAFPELFDLRAITTIGGNNSTDVTTRNALDILKLLHREDVPVGRGADSYLTNEFDEPVAKFHGANGLGDVEIPHSDRKPDPLAAWDKIYEQARLFPGELVLVTVGPETNLAMAFQKYPDLRQMIRKIVVMGGSLDRGNITEYGEANIWHDAEAGRIVFATGVPIDMVGLNVTRTAPLKQTIFEGTSENVREDVKDVIRRLIDFRNGEAMHDAIAISSLVSDDVMIWKDAYTYVVDGDVYNRGQTIADYDAEEKNSRVAVGIHLDAYYRIMKDMIDRYQ